MQYRIGESEIDCGRRIVRHQGTQVHVEPQVFELIVYLIENRERLVQRDEILARVWKGRIVSDAAIASRINAARRALGDDGRTQRIIATIHKSGFRVVAPVEEAKGRLGNPTIAVLPFEMLSDDRGEAFFARGIADELAATLGLAPWLEVRDPSAAFSDKLAGLEPSEVAERLDVAFLVLGTVQTDRANIRLSIRLIDPATRRLIWSDQFVAAKEDFFDLQDRVAGQLLGEIEPRLRRSVLQQSATRHGNFTAFEHYLRAIDLSRSTQLPGLLAACEALDLAVADFPEYAVAHAMRAWIATILVPQGRRVDEAAERERCHLALNHGAFDCDALAMAGYSLAFFDHQTQSGFAFLRRALALNPSSARAHDHLGWLLLYSGQASEARVHFQKALTLCPIDEFSFRMLTGQAFASFFLGDFATAESCARRAHAVAPSYSVCLRVLVATLSAQQKHSEARKALAKLLSVNPNLTLKRYQVETRFEEPEDRRALFEGLRSAGLQ